MISDNFYHLANVKKHVKKIKLMSNLSLYKKSFIDTFEIKNQYEKLKYNEIDEWDSIGHMNLISALEENFRGYLYSKQMTLQTLSFTKGKEIMSKYKIKI